MSAEALTKAVERLRKYGIYKDDLFDAYLEKACLNGCLIMGHDLLSHISIDNINDWGMIDPGTVTQEMRDAYEEDAGSIAQIIVEQYEDVLIKEYHRIFDDTNDRWWEMFSRWNHWKRAKATKQDMVDNDPHRIIGFFNDMPDTSFEDAERVLEKAIVRASERG